MYHLYTHGYTYPEAFAWRLFQFYWKTALFYLGLSYLIYILAIVIRRRAFTKTVYQKPEEKSVNDGVKTDTSIEYIKVHFQKEAERKKGRVYRCYQVLYIISSIMGFVGWVYLSISFAVLSSLDVMPVESVIAIILAFAFLKYIELIYILCPNFIKENKGHKVSSVRTKIARLFKIMATTMRLYKIRFAAYFLFALFFTFFLPLFAIYDTCLTHDSTNTEFGTEIYGYGTSTKLSRLFDFDKPCPDGKICHLYATLPEDGATSVFINVQTGVDISSITLKYDTLENFKASSQLLNEALATSYEAGLESLGNRYIHTVYLRNLTPNTNYYFEAHYKGEKLGDGNYLTLPSKDMEREIIMVSGGDAGNTPAAKEMTAAVSEYNPDVILIGGDVTYDNGMRACYYSYDLFFKMFEKVNEKAGRLVPMMFTLGNHDIGMNAFQEGKVDPPNNLFFMFFPQHSRTDSQGNLLPEVPNFAERLPYHYHTIGNTMHITLDSGFLNTYDGIQLEILKNTSEKFPDLVKLANYHVPAFPVNDYLGHRDDKRTVEDNQKYWVPVFQEYNYASVFEYHNHMYKRTYPILDGAPNPGGKGVVYFGDGSWGADVRNVHNNIFPELIEKSGSIHHVWIVKITSEELIHYAIDKSGKIVDEALVLPVKNYI